MSALWKLIFAISIVSMPLPARAVPITWTLQDVSFLDGATASGSYVYDASTDTYSDIDISTTVGSLRAAATYVTECGAVAGCVAFSPNPQAALLLTSGGDADGQPAFLIGLASPMTDLGGTIPLIAGVAEQVTCATSGGNLCQVGGTPVDRVTAGSVSASELPEPGGTGILVVALITLWYLRRRPDSKPLPGMGFGLIRH